MKKVLFALALATTLVLTSCGGDDDNGPATDCFDCRNSALQQTTTYCYTEGNNFYTVRIAGGQAEQMTFVDGQTWATVKAAIQGSAACGQ